MYLHRVIYAGDQAGKVSLSNTPKLSEIFFDAKKIHYNVGEEKQKFEGDVVAITAGLLISADEIFVDKLQNVLDAKGHVMIISNHYMLIGEQLTYHVDNHLFRLEKGKVFWGEHTLKDGYLKKNLGITVEEIQARADRKKHLSDIEEKKDYLRKEYNRTQRDNEKKENLIKQYITLLQKEKLLKKEDSHFFVLDDSKKMKLYQLRRRAWNQKSSILTTKPKLEFAKAYFMLTGDTIMRVDEYTYQSTQSLWTPCRCGLDESPAWGFRSSKVDAQIGGYADLYNPVLEIKGVPVLYLPYLKVPLKAERQAGLLRPNISHHNRNGTIYSQSLFLPLDQEQDVTLTANWIKKRGLKLSSDYRLQYAPDSAWNVQVAGLRDREWLVQNIAREKFLSVYGGSLPTGNDKQSKYNLSPLSNRWRGKLKWRGSTYITPRLSFASEGAYVSDHLYNQDLETPTIRPNIFKTNIDSNVFEKTNMHFNLAHEHYFLSLGSELSDQLLLNERFAGYQMPLVLKFRSRYVPLFGIRSFLKIYSQLQFDHKTIGLFKAQEKEIAETNRMKVSLGKGVWQRAKIRSLFPLFSNRIFALDYFLDLEGRRISYYRDDLLENKENTNHSDSYLASLRTGLVFNLPIEGYFPFLDEVSYDKGATIHKNKKLEHRMNWQIELSHRPNVSRKGEYGTFHKNYTKSGGAWVKNDNSPPLTYFVTDRTDLFNSDYFFDKEILHEHKKVALSTSHQFIIHKKTKTVFKELLNTNNLPIREIAKRELSINSVEILSNKDSSMYQEKTEKAEDEQQLVSVNTSIDYDFIKARERKTQHKIPNSNSNVLETPEAWSPVKTDLSMSISPITLTLSNSYNIYKKISTQNSLATNMTIPLKTTIGLTKKLSKDLKFEGSNQYTITSSNEIHYYITSNAIPYFTVGYNYGVKTITNSKKDQYYYAISLTYLSSSDCWGLDFLWQKNFEESSNKGTYYLSLTLKALGKTNKYGNLLSKLN